MYDTFASIRDTLAFDGEISSKGGVVALTLDSGKATMSMAGSPTTETIDTDS